MATSDAAQNGRVKGAQLVTTIKTLRAQRERAKQFLPAHLHHYLEERTVMSSWYPEEDYRSLLHALGRVIEGSVEGNVWRAIGEAGAKTDTKGAYSTTVRSGDPLATLQLAVRTWHLHHDSGRVVVKVESATSAIVELHDYAVIDAKLADINAGYLCGMLRAAGAKAARARVLEVPAAVSGPTLIELSWS